jgi:Geranylgeranyl pyrophosphate synthase
LKKQKKLDIDEETYFEIIEKKTASLISSCCKICSDPLLEVKNLKFEKFARIGLNIGIPFQKRITFLTLEKKNRKTKGNKF